MIATELSGLIVEVRGAREPARLARPAAVPARRPALPHWRSPRSNADIEIQRAEIRGLRAQWRTKREDIKAAQSQQVYAQADFERQKDLAERKFAPVAKLEEARMGLEVARQRIAAARGGPAAHRGAARRRSQDQGRRPSQGQADAGGARRGAAQPAPHHDRGADRRHRLQGAGAGQLCRRRACRRSPWSPTPTSGSRPTSRRPSSPACGSASRSPSRSTPIPT